MSEREFEEVESGGFRSVVAYRARRLSDLLARYSEAIEQEAEASTIPLAGADSLFAACAAIGFAATTKRVNEMWSYIHLGDKDSSTIARMELVDAIAAAADTYNFVRANPDIYERRHDDARGVSHEGVKYRVIVDGVVVTDSEQQRQVAAEPDAAADSDLARWAAPSLQEFAQRHPQYAAQLDAEDFTAALTAWVREDAQSKSKWKVLTELATKAGLPTVEWKSIKSDWLKWKNIAGDTLLGR